MGYGGLDGTRQKFTQKERDSESGLDYFGARYYSSAHGRFTSPDPTLESGRAESPETWNRYSYARCNPLAYIDPDGKDVILVVWATHDGNIGHSGIAVSNYREERVQENGQTVTRMVSDGTYTYRDLWPAEAVGKSNFDQNVPAYYGNERVTLDQLVSGDPSGSEGYSPDGAIRLQTDYSTDQAVSSALDQIQSSNPNYNGLKCNCSDFPEQGVEAAAGKATAGG
jgi:RHS repeat-associated protein